MYLSVYGHLNVDFLLQVPEIPMEGSIFTNGTTVRAGGTARNISLVSGKLGMENEIFSKVGKDFPKNYIMELEKNGVSTKNILIDERYNFSPVCFIVSDLKKQVAFIDQGPMNDNGLEYKKLPSGNFVHFGTGDPHEYLKIKERIEKNVSFDPGQEIHYRYSKETFTSMLEGSKFLFLNRKEFEKAKEFLDSENMLNLTENIIVTLGSDGCLIMNKNEKFTMEAYKVNAKETLGAGDSFRAGFYLGIKNQFNLRKSCLLGMKIASIVVMHGSIPQNFPPLKELINSL
ncbi:MAG: PfkB family carbohydrate kinase [Thermoplasmata archaeon]